MTGHADQPGIRLRPGRTLDAGALGAAMTQAAMDQPWLDHPYSAAEDIAHAAAMLERGWVTVADCAHGVGFLARDGAEVHALYVARPARRHGLARALLRDAQDRHTVLTLRTHPENAPARTLYRRAGFIETGRSRLDGTPQIHLHWAAEDTDRRRA